MDKQLTNYWNTRNVNNSNSGSKHKIIITISNNTFINFIHTVTVINNINHIQDQFVN